MERVRRNKPWTLFDPAALGAVLLSVDTLHFKETYEALEARGGSHKSVDARHLLDVLCESQRVTGGPCLLFQDRINGKH